MRVPRFKTLEEETAWFEAHAEEVDGVDLDENPFAGRGLRRHDPNDDDIITRAGKALAALRYAVDLPTDMQDLAYEQVKAALVEAAKKPEACPCVDCDQPTGHPESPDPQTFVIKRD